MTLTDEYKKDYYPAATLENNAAALLNEQAVYDIKNNDPNIRSTSEIPGYTTTCTNCSYPNKNGGTNPLDPPVNNNPAANVTAPSQRMYRLNGTDQNARIGLGVTLKVMADDKVDIWGKSYWQNTGTTVQNNNPVSAVLTSLLTSLLGSPAVTGGAPHAGVTAGGLSGTGSPTSAPLTDIVNGNNPPANTQTPKAGINWILFDEQFRPVKKGSVYESNYSPVSTNGNEVTTHTMTASVAESGYLYVYCSNESNKDVFFDNLQVIDRRGPLTEENSYYPFGLTMAGISSKALSFGDPGNKRKFNDGTELENKEFSDGSGLEWYATDYRSYDPQLGRFFQIDELADGTPDFSPYSYAANNPILINDPLGLDTLVASGTSSTGETVYTDPTAAPLQEVVVTSTKKPTPTSTTSTIAANLTKTAGIVIVAGGGPLDVPADVVAAALLTAAAGYLIYNWMSSLDETPPIFTPTPNYIPLSPPGVYTTPPAYTPPSPQSIVPPTNGNNIINQITGERGQTGRADGTNNPFKKLKPHPTDPKKCLTKDANGKEKTVAKPDGFDEWWKSKH